MESMYILLVPLLFLVGLDLVSSAPVLEGDNVCEKEETFNVTISVPKKVPFQVKSYEYCLRVPPRCAVYKTEYKTEYQNETSTSKKMIKICCEGYAEYQGKCVSQIIHYHVTSSPGEVTPIYRIDSLNPAASVVTAGQGRDNGATASPGLWVGISLSLLVVTAIFMLLLLKYKKKLLQVKEELNYVTYSVDRGSSVGGENTSVYSSVNPSDPNIPNNSVRTFVVNDLKSSNPSSGHPLLAPTASTSIKSSNIERALALKKTRDLESSDDSSNDSCLASTSSAKPLNPNLYLSPLDGKDTDKEPIYEEVPDSISQRSSIQSRGLPVTPQDRTMSPTNSSIGSNSRMFACNDLSGHSVYDRPRPSNLNISLSSPTACSTPLNMGMVSPKTCQTTANEGNTRRKLESEFTAKSSSPGDREHVEIGVVSPSLMGTENGIIPVLETSFSPSPSPSSSEQEKETSTSTQHRDKPTANEAVYSLDVNSAQQE